MGADSSLAALDCGLVPMAAEVAPQVLRGHFRKLCVRCSCNEPASGAAGNASLGAATAAEALGRPMKRGERGFRAVVSSVVGCRRRNDRGNVAIGSIQYFDRAIERIACAALRDDEPRCGRIGFYLAAQPRHLNIDRAIIDLVVIHVTRLEELIACENPLRRGEQCGEQVELAVGEINASTVALLEAPGTQIELEFGKT